MSRGERLAAEPGKPAAATESQARAHPCPCGVRVMPDGLWPCATLGAGPPCPIRYAEVEAAFAAEMENAPRGEAGGAIASD